MPAIPWTGPQLIYRNLATEPGTDLEPGVCRICGGPLLGPSVGEEHLSGSWTDENLCLRRDSNRICAACAWFTTGNNRLNFWRGEAGTEITAEQKKLPGSVLFASEKESKNMSVLELLDFLASGFPTPCVFLLRGEDFLLSQKHQEWRLLHSMVYRRDRTIIPYVGLQLFGGNKISGVAEFDTDKFLALVDEMAEMGREYVLPTLGRLKSEWARQNATFRALLKGCEQTMAPDIYLAAYFASIVAIYRKGGRAE